MILIFGTLSAGGSLLMAMGQVVADASLPAQIFIGTVFGLAAVSFVGQFFGEP